MKNSDLDHVCPECGHESLERAAEYHRCKRDECGLLDVYGRCNECLAELECTEVIGTGFDSVCVFECPVCDYIERSEPSKLVQPP